MKEPIPYITPQERKIDDMQWRPLHETPKYFIDKRHKLLNVRISPDTISQNNNCV